MPELWSYLSQEPRSGDPSGEFHVTSLPIGKLYIPEVLKRVDLFGVSNVVRTEVPLFLLPVFRVFWNIRGIKRRFRLSSLLDYTSTGRFS
ncbi:hypothetical protein AVEN_190735-1 [Araneus ventricosus]|uniref:Uncharacterized protein n=1 Tax=Araneus ventricosus TaxID=182803 RepID=A0A4Y1ZQ82_ARAVE|nr:hypothetical protein AVEN_190735-1 [Araneus ventricosus]